MYHNHTKYAGKTVEWIDFDSKEMYDRNLKDHYTQLEQGGWINTTIEYKFNYYGFRDWEFPDQLEFLALGCSHTLGHGLHADQAWPSQLSQLIDNKVYNGGVSGAAMDTVYRIAKELVPRHKPSTVFLLAPNSMRFELANENDTWDVINVHADRDICTDHYFMYGQNSFVNFNRNLHAIKHICAKNNANLICLTADHDFRADYAARDLMHSGPEVMAELAERFYNMYQETK